MPLHHSISKSIIIHVFVIFIRTNHLAQFVAILLGIPLNATHPKDSGIQDNFSTTIAHPFIIFSCLPIKPRTVGNIRTDVNLAIAAPNPDILGIRIVRHRPSRRHFIPRIRTFPRIHCPFIPIMQSLAPRTR